MSRSPLDLDGQVGEPEPVDVVHDDVQMVRLPRKLWDAWCSDDCHDASAAAAAVSA